MVLNLLRVEEVNPEYMMERSFHQFQNYSNIPKLYGKVKELEEKVEDFDDVRKQTHAERKALELSSFAEDNNELNRSA